VTLLTKAADRKNVGLHAILIGVGVYPHLESGSSKKKFALGEGMTQLTSPYHSVEAFATWLQREFRLTNTPLRSLRVLASSPEGHGTYTAPTMGAIKSSVDDWVADVDTHEDNFALFYFCGHGLFIGNVTALLAQDFGRSANRPFENSFDPQKLEAGMLGCKAARQLFIVDACSNAPRDLLKTYRSIAPAALVEPTDSHHRLGVTKQAELRASELGTTAFGQVGKPSVFMESFLLSLQGAGTLQNGEGKWVAQTTPLRIGVDWLVKRAEKKETQWVSFGPGVASEMDFHELPGNPLVPVKVICKPLEKLAQSSLTSSSGHSRPTPLGEAWHFDVPFGEYEFSAKDELTGTISKATSHASPAYRVVSIQCEE
jgi:hypothetical protein